MTRQRPLVPPTDLADPIFSAALELARPELRGIRVRLVGISVSGLGAPEQLALFEPGDDRRRRAVAAADDLRRRFGERVVTRARLVGSGLPAPFERDPSSAPERRHGLARPADDGTGRRGPTIVTRSDTQDVTDEREIPDEGA
jgi:nucleotidyltransferase/DNA polymerase involved in DNA repair